MNKQVRINVTTVVNKSKIRREKRHGRDVMIVPSATMPDDIVMNGSAGPVLYPAEEIEKSFRHLERTPAPLGHPMVNGRFVSASDPEGINVGWIGAWNENVRRENGRVLLDKVIDVEVANRSEGGKRVLNALEGQAPVHTSTGLLAKMEAVNGEGLAHKHVARDLVFDHDAILLDEAGAATPEKGVGIFVNSSGSEEEIEVINSSLDESVDDQIGWLADDIVTRVTKPDRAPLLEKLKTAIKDVVRGFDAPATETKEPLSVNQEQVDAINAKMDSLATAVSGMADTIGGAVTNALKPLTDQMAANAEAAKAKETAERDAVASKVVNAGLLDEEAAKEASLAVLNSLAAKIKAPVGHAVTVNGQAKAAATTKGGFKLPAAE